MKLDERISRRDRLLLFSTLELLRKEIRPKFSDWKDADDWLFSQLDFTKDELAQIYKGRDVLYHDASAVDIEAARKRYEESFEFVRDLGDGYKVLKVFAEPDLEMGYGDIYSTKLDYEKFADADEYISGFCVVDAASKTVPAIFSDFLPSIDAAVCEYEIFEQNNIEMAVYDLLETFGDVYQNRFDTNDSAYKMARRKLESYCDKRYPELSDMVRGTFKSDLLFRDSDGGFVGYYYNPDSAAGGQIVKYTFDTDQLSRIVAGEEYFNVIAENTQYLSDIDTVHFFNTIFEIVDEVNAGTFLGVLHSQDQFADLCKDFLNPASRHLPLDQQISDSQKTTTSKSTDDMSVIRLEH